MARQQRNSIDYFPHSVTHGKGMFFIRQKYKNNGYAVWMILLEKLGASEYHYLDMKDEIQIMYLSAECMVDKNILIDIINDLVLLGEFDALLWNNDSILFNEKFILSIKDAYKKRSNECIDRESLITTIEAKGRSISLKSKSNGAKSKSEGSVKPQSKVKYSKEEKRINKPFYDSQLEEAKNKTEIKLYETYVAFMFGDNELKRPLDRCLEIKDQIGYERFIELLEIAKKQQKSVTQTTMGIENYEKKYISLSSTLGNWLRRNN